MLILENIKLAFGALFSNKMRSLLTMLGIIIGIGSVIAIMTVSSSLTVSISDSFQEMGANNITVGVKKSSEEEEVRSNGMRFGVSGRTASMEEEDYITDEMIEALQSAYQEEIEAVALNETIGNGTAESGNTSSNISLMGINADYFAGTQLSLLSGRKITQADLEGSRKVVMVSDKLVDTLFDGDREAVLGQAVNINYNNAAYKYYIVGVYEYEENSNFNSSSDEDIATEAYIPLTTGKEMVHSEDGYSRFTVVTAAGISSVSEFANRIKAFFAPYYAANEDYEIAVSTMESMTESMNEMIQTVTIAIAFIAGISLLVGGIGVMNIMLVSITERTREIGTRKALGAKNSSIRLQFIIESVILCLVGGCLGIAAGFILGAFAASMLGYAAAAPIGAIVLAVGFSVAVGIFFGYYPANKAAKLDPIEALRYE